jgi:hypothetical protein
MTAGHKNSEEQQTLTVDTQDGYREKYNDADADLVLVSSDGVKFRVFSFLLKAHR